MQIFRDLAGYSLGRADIVRRAMSKKKHDVLNREHEVFLHGQRREDGSWEVEGCVNRGVDEATAEALFKEIQNFASYAFNKSHAAAYAVVAYQTGSFILFLHKKSRDGMVSATARTCGIVSGSRLFQSCLLPFVLYTL